MYIAPRDPETPLIYFFTHFGGRRTCGFNSSFSSVITGHKSKLLSTAAPEYVQYLAVGTTTNTSPNSSAIETAFPPRTDHLEKQIYFKVDRLM